MATRPTSPSAPPSTTPPGIPACARRRPGSPHPCRRAPSCALVEGAERAGIWTVQTGIFPENTASLELHRRCGFREVGIRERLGQHHGRWRDVVLLERRSATAGRG
jgi:hypothetical protein